MKKAIEKVRSIVFFMSGIVNIITAILALPAVAVLLLILTGSWIPLIIVGLLLLTDLWKWKYFKKEGYNQPSMSFSKPDRHL